MIILKYFIIRMYEIAIMHILYAGILCIQIQYTSTFVNYAIYVALGNCSHFVLLILSYLDSFAKCP